MKRRHVIIYMVVLSAVYVSAIISIINNTGSQKYSCDRQFGALAGTLYNEPEQQAQWNRLSCEQKKVFLERLVMLSFSPLITEAVNKYYGELRGYDLQGITDLKALVFEHEIKIQISTFVGPHNPPYGLDTLTIRFKELGDGEVVDFQHSGSAY